MCKKYFIEALLKELGVIGERSDTFTLCNGMKKDVMERQINECNQHKHKYESPIYIQYSKDAYTLGMHLDFYAVPVQARSSVK